MLTRTKEVTVMHDMYDNGWAMGGFMLLCLLLVTALVVVLVSVLTPPSGRHSRDREGRRDDAHRPD